MFQELVDEEEEEASGVVELVVTADAMGEAAEFAANGSGLESSTVVAAKYFGPLTEPIEPELVTELVTVGSSDHLHKIDHIVLQVEVM